MWWDPHNHGLSLFVMVYMCFNTNNGLILGALRCRVGNISVAPQVPRWVASTAGLLSWSPFVVGPAVTGQNWWFPGVGRAGNPQIIGDWRWSLFADSFQYHNLPWPKVAISQTRGKMWRSTIWGCVVRRFVDDLLIGQLEVGTRHGQVRRK